MTMYKETLRNKVFAIGDEQKLATLPQEKPASKVNRICDRFLHVLKTRTATNLQNLITAHLCKVPPDFEAGLLEVSKLQSECQSLPTADLLISRCRR